MNFLKKFLFLDNINKLISKNICKIKDISIIVLINPSEENNQTKINKFYEIIHFCKANNLPFFVSNNYKLAIKTKANGVYLTSSNRKIIYKNFKNQQLILEKFCPFDSEISVIIARSKNNEIACWCA